MLRMHLGILVHPHHVHMSVADLFIWLLCILRVKASSVKIISGLVNHIHRT